MLDLSYKKILSVALPLMGSSFIQSIVFLTDTSFLTRYDVDSFDASGNAGLIYITVFMALIGFSDGAQIIFARRIGQERFDTLGRIFGSSVLTMSFIAILLALFLKFVMPDFLLSYSKHQDIAVLQNDFLSIRSNALLFGMIAMPIHAFFLAHGKTWVVLMAALVTASSNIILDYGMIFGNLGFSEMGLEGAAWASTIADGLGMLTLVIFLVTSKENKEHRLLTHLTVYLPTLKELFKVSAPVVAQGILALATWTIFFTWIEQMGKFELTVSQNIRALYFLAFVPLWGFAGTTKTYISQYIGAKRFDELKIIQRKIQLMTMAFMLVVFHGSLLYPEFLISLINPNIEYIDKSADILRFISGSMFLFGFVSVYFQTINGSGNTFYTFLVELVSVGIYVIASYLLIKVWQLDIYWVWSVEYIYFTSMGVLSIAYLKLFDWKKKEV